jgi:hypothetical protein
MKKMYLVLPFMVVSLFYAHSQQVANHEDFTISTLSYSPQLPEEGSFKIVKNNSGKDIAEEILKQVNFHRRGHENFLWKVDENIEILIYPILPNLKSE